MIFKTFVFFLHSNKHLGKRIGKYFILFPCVCMFFNPTTTSSIFFIFFFLVSSNRLTMIEKKMRQKTHYFWWFSELNRCYQLRRCCEMFLTRTAFYWLSLGAIDAILLFFFSSSVSSSCYSVTLSNSLLFFFLSLLCECVYFENVHCSIAINSVSRAISFPF